LIPAKYFKEKIKKTMLFLCDFDLNQARCVRTHYYILYRGRQMEIKEDRGQLKMKGRMDLNNTSLLFRLLVKSVGKREQN